MFLRRYWYGDTVEEAARWAGWSLSRTKSALFRMRNRLKDYLKKEELYHANLPSPSGRPTCTVPPERAAASTGFSITRIPTKSSISSHEEKLLAAGSVNP